MNQPSNSSQRSITLDQGLDTFLSQTSLADHLECAIAIIAPDHTVLYENAAFTRLAKLPKYSSVTGSPKADLLSLDVVESAVRACIADKTGNIVAHTFQIDRFVSMNLSVQLQPILVKGSVAVEAVLITIAEENIFFDNYHVARNQFNNNELIERIKVISDDLSSKNKLVKDLLNNTPFAIMLIDNKRNVIRMNKACEELFGTTTSNVTGNKCDQFLHCYKIDNRCPILDDKRQINNDETLAIGCSRADTTLLRSAVVLDQGKEESIILEAFIDITDRKRNEEELAQHRSNLETLVKERTQDLETVNKELEAFCYSISHDLRAPVRAMHGFSSALLEDHGESLDESGIDYLNRVQSASIRMGDLIDDLLSLSRLTRGGYKPSKLDFSSLCQSVWGQLISDHPDRQVEFEVEKDLRVIGDKNLLLILLENLLGNALKFTGATAKARIVVGSENKDGETIYYIRDNGAGFDMSYRDKLFQPFERLHDHSEFEGNGIGLAIVSRVVNRHGGHIWAEGGVGKGATFYFTLS